MHFYMRNGKTADSKSLIDKVLFMQYIHVLLSLSLSSFVFLSLVDTFRKKRNLKSLGMPHFVGHGSHDLNDKKHRFIVMPRFGSDVWSLYVDNGKKMPLHTVYRLAIQMVSSSDISPCAGLLFTREIKIHAFCLTAWRLRIHSRVHIRSCWFEGSQYAAWLWQEWRPSSVFGGFWLGIAFHNQGL